jgi:rare lipoprotein A
VEVVAIDPKEPAPTLPVRALEDAPAGAPPRLFLQVGAFGSRSNAERLRARLVPNVSSDVRIQTLSEAPSPIYRVQVGPLGSVELADVLSGRLQQLGLGDTHVVIE